MEPNLRHSAQSYLAPPSVRPRTCLYNLKKYDGSENPHESAASVAVISSDKRSDSTCSIRRKIMNFFGVIPAYRLKISRNANSLRPQRRARFATVGTSESFEIGRERISRAGEIIDSSWSLSEDIFSSLASVEMIVQSDDFT